MGVGYLNLDDLTILSSVKSLYGTERGISQLASSILAIVMK